MRWAIIPYIRTFVGMLINRMDEWENTHHVCEHNELVVT